MITKGGSRACICKRAAPDFLSVRRMCHVLCFYCGLYEDFNSVKRLPLCPSNNCGRVFAPSRKNALCSRSRDVNWRERCEECFYSPDWIEADIENTLKLSSIMSSSANNVQQKLLLFLQQKSDRIEFVTVELMRPEFNLHRCSRSKQAPSGRWRLAPRLERTPAGACVVEPFRFTGMRSRFAVSLLAASVLRQSQTNRMTTERLVRAVACCAFATRNHRTPELTAPLRGNED